MTRCHQLPAINNHGWTEDSQVKWIESAFPDDVASIMLTDEIEGDYEEINNGSDDSDDSDNDDI